MKENDGFRVLNILAWRYIQVIVTYVSYICLRVSLSMSVFDYRVVFRLVRYQLVFLGFLLLIICLDIIIFVLVDIFCVVYVLYFSILFSAIFVQFLSICVRIRIGQWVVREDDKLISREYNGLYIELNLFSVYRGFCGFLVIIGGQIYLGFY